MTCCCVVPIKCGVTTIGVFAIVLATVELSAQFFLMLNDQVQWWYCVVNLALLLPTYIAASFFVVWFGKDTVESRGRLGCACILIIVSAGLMATWAIVYFVWIHDGDTVYYGWGTTQEGYVKYQKKYYLFRELAWGIIVIGLFSYFICICGRYSRALRQPRSGDEKKAYKLKKGLESKAEIALDAINSGKPDPFVKEKKKRKKAAKEKAKKKKEKEGGDDKAAAEGDEEKKE